MARDLFRQVLQDRPPVRAGRLSGLQLSVVFHAFVLVAVVAVPLITPDVLPLVQASNVIWTPVVLPPSPPPIAGPASRPPARAEAVARSQVPLDAPKGISAEPLMVPDTPPVPEAPELAGVVPGMGVPGGTGAVLPDAPPPARPATPVLASSLLTPPVRIRDASPVYPEIPRLARQEGQVVIEAVIGVTGDVVEAHVLRATPLFVEAALTAVKQWKYRPTLLNGRPVPVVMTVTVTFRLR